MRPAIHETVVYCFPLSLLHRLCSLLSPLFLSVLSPSSTGQLCHRALCCCVVCCVVFCVVCCVQVGYKFSTAPPLIPDLFLWIPVVVCGEYEQTKPGTPCMPQLPAVSVCLLS